MTIRAVVFDLDGTLASFNLDYMTVRSDVRSLLIKKGIPASILASNESIFDMLKKTEIFLKNNGKSQRVINKTYSEAFSIAEKYELEAAKTTGLLPGVTETLKTLKERNLKLGLCTINSEKSVSYILKRFSIQGLFDAIIPRNKVKNVKPNVEHLEMTLNALKIPPSEALLVGDGIRDMQCAHDLGVVAVGLSTGISSEKDLTKSGADYSITSITDLPPLIATINKR